MSLSSLFANGPAAGLERDEQFLQGRAAKLAPAIGRAWPAARPTRRRPSTPITISVGADHCRPGRRRRGPHRHPGMASAQSATHRRAAPSRQPGPAYANNDDPRILR